MDIPDSTLYQLAAAAAKRHPDLPAYEFLGKKTSCKAFLRQIHLAAKGFHAMGIRRGDRVAICLPNCPQAVIGFYALNRLGAVCVMLHPLAAPGELASALETAGAEVLLTLERLARPIKGADRRQLTVVTARLPDEPLPRSFPGRLSWSRMLQAGAHTNLPPDRGRGFDPAVILFSGGTGGAPKGVLHTNHSCNAAACQLLQVSGLEEPAGLRILSLLPLFHGFGLIVGIHAPLLSGVCCVLIPRFRTTDLGRLLLKKRPNLLPAVPAMLDAIRTGKQLEGKALPFLQAIYCGGDVLPQWQKQKLERFFAAHGADVPIRLGYGLTECVAAATLSPEGRPGTAGQALPGMEVEICRPGTTDVTTPGLEGEICLTGPTVMVEYVQNPEETARTLRRHRDGRLWLHTGDLGHLDAWGLLHFSQRLKRMIVTSGYNVYPCQLEAVLQTHPLVRQVCVIGVPDPCRGQIIRAVIVPADRSLTEPQLREFCRSRMARYAQPREYEFRPSLPLTRLGKVDWQALQP